ncbi:FAD-dependent oxidoreductase [Demequina sp. NBRC 110052]|uniref:FAD-dependent oxidoreductase n=1 Tax=Demequina sp. NBRC 110052 TaxID=1570341 RepID=UPI0009FE2C8C|nr:FAD-dependent oxidoreductase [Demequina sp. NBRC 110052]
MTDTSWDCVIIGGGVAGLSAALMLGRARRRTLVLDSGQPRNRFADHMHGVLGHDGRAPHELLALGRSEVTGYGVVVEAGSARAVAERSGGLTVTTEDREIQTRTVLLSTGLADRLPEIPGLAERWGRTVLHCPYCHGWEVRDRRLGVLVADPRHLHLATILRQWSDAITVFASEPDIIGTQHRARLEARGTRIVTSPIARLDGAAPHIGAVVTADGASHTIDALFAAGAPEPQHECVTGLGLAMVDTATGRAIEVQPDGATSNPRVWAAGNVADPMAAVPVAAGSGSVAGARINAFLAEEDTDHAVASGHGWKDVAPVDFWEQRYAESERAWSGNVNATVAEIAGGLEPGTALDLGCGEGADVIWLAEHGWTAHGIDISPTAVARGTAVAAQRRLAASFEAADLATAEHTERYDLVLSSFLHSPVALPRAEILRRAAGAVAEGGHLLLVTHAAPPPWASPEHVRERTFLTAREEADALGLGAPQWEEIRVGDLARTVRRPDGEIHEAIDGVVLLRRRDA